jgi:rRNA maturation endonuclease Nob1
MLRDLGGLLVEMYRRGGFRDDLLAERSAEVIGIDSRIAEIEALLHRREPSARCTCGAPLLRGSHFCPNCGRPVGIEPVAVEANGAAGDETIIEPAPEG